MFDKVSFRMVIDSSFLPCPMIPARRCPWGREAYAGHHLKRDHQVRFLAALRAQGVAKVFLYSLHSQDYFDDGGEWRAITTGDGFLHTQGAAVAALAQQIEDHHFTLRVKAAAGVWAYLFQADDDSRAVALLAPDESHAEYRLPAGALDLFGNAVPAGAPIGRTVCYLPLPTGANDLPGE